LVEGSLVAVLLRTNINRVTVKCVCFALVVGALSTAIIDGHYGILARNSLLGATLQHTVICGLFSGVS
jgi:hypothetical protein